MKKLMVLAILLSCTLMMKAQNEAFEKLAATKGVEVVYISHSMFNMMSNMLPNMKMNGRDIGGVASKLSSVMILSGETKDAAGAIKTEMEIILKAGKYEQMMYVKDDSSKTVFYTKKSNSKDAGISELLMLSDEDNDVSVIRITGDLSVDDIQSITAKK